MANRLKVNLGQHNPHHMALPLDPIVNPNLIVLNSTQLKSSPERTQNVLAMRFYITGATVVAVLLFAVSVACLIVAVGERRIVESVKVSKVRVPKFHEPIQKSHVP